MKLSHLKNTLAKRKADRDKILKVAESEGRAALNEEEEERMAEIEKEIEGIKRNIKRVEARQAEALEELDGEKRNADPEDDDDESKEERELKPEAGKKPAAEARQTKVFNNLGDQLTAIKRAQDPTCDADLRVEAHNKLKALRAVSGASEAVESEGGFLVQEDIREEIMTRSYDEGVLWQKVDKLTLGARSNRLKTFEVDEDSRANGSRLGGVTVKWVNEGDTATASKPKLREFSVELKKILGFYYETNELAEDAPANAELAMSGFASEIAFQMDEAIFNGDGNMSPNGIFGSDSLVTVSKEGSQAAATVNYKNVLKMYSRLWARSYKNAEWFINQEVIPQLALMELSVGTGGSAVFLPAGGASGKPYMTLFGLPINVIEHASALGTKGDISLLDLSQYLVINKGQLRTDSSIHVQFLYDEQCFRIALRIGGKPKWKKVLTPYKGASTLSPFVALETRS